MEEENIREEHMKHKKENVNEGINSVYVSTFYKNPESPTEQVYSVV